jgi:hypothetical protein
MYLCCLYGAVHNGFEAGKIHYEGWALEIEPEKVEISRAHPLPMPRVMDLPASK